MQKFIPKREEVNNKQSYNKLTNQKAMPSIKANSKTLKITDRIFSSTVSS